MKRFVMWWAATGTIVPVMVELLHYLAPSGLNDYFVVFIWPSSIGTMGIHDSGASAALIVMLLIALNTILYSAIGTMLWWIKSALTGTRFFAGLM